MTYLEAKDELFGIVNAQLAAAVTDDVIEAGFPVFWPGMPMTDTPPNNGHWVRVFYVTVRDIQASLAKLDGISRYEALGQLLVQIYSPISVAGSSENGNILAEMVRGAFRQPSPSGVMTFTNQVIKEAANTLTHFLTNVVVECTYDNYQ